MAIVAQETPQALAMQAESNVALMFERLASNPDVDVAKLERLIAMQERILAHNAEAAFNSAFAEMQPEIPVILERAEGDGGKWGYAPLEDIVEPLRPILVKHGFSISHTTEWPDARLVKVIGILTHRAGHSRRSEFQAAADKSGSKNDIQALGSSVSYGKRYTVKDLLCIVTRGADDDGAAAGKKESPTPPAGFQAWWDDLAATADNGLRVFAEAWNKSKPEFRTYATRHYNRETTALKARASKVSAS